VEQAIELLMNEHRLIEQVLGSLETLVVEVEGGLNLDRPVLADYGAFFREFADALHHGKEEDDLFARMAERGFSRESGPLAVMLHEHRAGRAHVAVLREAGLGSAPLSGVDVQLVVEHASAFVPLLRAHILKEDRILYPMAVRFLPPDELAAMASRFAADEAQRRADGSLERLHGLAERLVSQFRPDAGRMAAAAGAPACAG
jgi:hemerythrin-like domain-containing protein